MTEYKNLRDQAYEANMQLPALNLVLFTFGNVSAADQQKGLFAIKPSGVPYTELTPEMMVVVDFDGKTVAGTLRPSSDTPTHAVLYKNWPEIEGISHTHSTYATSWAQSLSDIPIYGTTHADHISMDIPCAPPMDDSRITGNYELETGFQIIDHLVSRQYDYRQVEMILVGNHAPFTWGRSAAKAVYNSAVLENIAHLAFLTQQINDQAQRMKPSLILKHFERKHGPDSYYGQG
jgi:L-ribulose-5-phosphate 4-epimerase